MNVCFLLTIVFFGGEPWYNQVCYMFVCFVFYTYFGVLIAQLSFIILLGHYFSIEKSSDNNIYSFFSNMIFCI